MSDNPRYDDAFCSMKAARNAGIPHDNEAMYLLQEAQIEATLALAYEARTANLIATLRVGAVDMTDWPQQVINNFHRTAEEIAVRMGIEGANK